LDCGFPEAPRPVYKRGRGAARFELYLSALRENPNCLLKPLAARLASLLLLARDLARVKQTARRRRRYVAMPTSSSSAAATPPADASSEETLSTVAAKELRAGDTVDFGASRMSSVRVQDMQRFGYFGGRVARVPGAEEIPEPEGELVVFEAFFVAGLRLPAHRFVGEVLRRFNVQVHQLTPNAVVALSKYVWATTSYGGQPSIEVFAKYYCLHWQKRMIGNKIAQFGSCTFTPKTGKTSMEVVELVPCARNKWGNWHEFWFYVAEGAVEDHPGLPVAEMCSHFYSAYPQFEVAEEDADEGALQCMAGLSSGRDLVEEFVAYGVWPLAHGWALGEVCPRQMPSHGGMLVRSPAFALDLHSRDPAAFVREAEDEAVRIVGRYVPKTEGQRSWDIRGSNDRLNRVFELNRLPGGWWPKNVPIPCAAGEDFFTSRMVRDWKVFPYGRNIVAVVSAVMDKDRQGAAQKRQAVVRLPEARPKRSRGTAKAAAPGGSQLPLGPVGCRRLRRRPPTGPNLSRPEPRRPENCLRAGKRVADFATDISVEDYLVGKSIARGFYLTVDVLQGQAKGNLLLFRPWWRPRRLPWCLGRGVALSAPVVRFRRSLPSGTRRAPCAAG
jgi:hypothetical protein